MSMCGKSIDKYFSYTAIVVLNSRASMFYHTMSVSLAIVKFYFDTFFVRKVLTASCQHNLKINGMFDCLDMRHYSADIISAMASQITGVPIACSTVCSGEDKRKCQSSASVTFVRGIHWWPVDSPHKGPVRRKMFPFDDIVMFHHFEEQACNCLHHIIISCSLILISLTFSRST